MLKFKIPQELSHLRIADSGYPIPFFVLSKDGNPEFAKLSVEKQSECINKKLCAICGRKLYRDYIYFISGPVGYKNKVSSDPAMHRTCAEFSLQACPHMRLQKAKRRRPDEGDITANSQIILPKPDTLLLVKAVAKFKILELPKGGVVIRYSPVSAELYSYDADGFLTKNLFNDDDTK